MVKFVADKLSANGSLRLNLLNEVLNYFTLAFLEFYVL